MRIHIIGICGTIMGSLGVLAKQLGHTVTGQDKDVYPPMSTQLEAQGLTLIPGYEIKDLEACKPDLIIIGNVASRGWPIVEYILNRNLPYISGAQWLYEAILKNRHTLAVSGTHGKTTTTSMLAYILRQCGLNTGYFIGGVPQDLPASADLGATHFVLEADEYDTAFFDKRAKLVHYHPRTLIINNLEYDHADIYPDVASIQRQFHHLIRTIPGEGQIIVPAQDAGVAGALALGCWTPTVTFGPGGAWSAHKTKDDGSAFSVHHQGQKVGEVTWGMLGDHNVNNALAALAAAAHVGITPAQGCAALARFQGVKRRLEVRGVVNNITVYDDFAHHPTAIRTTLEGLRHRLPTSRIIAVLEPRSASMKMGAFKDSLAAAFAVADHVVLYQSPEVKWDVNTLTTQLGPRGECHTAIPEVITAIVRQTRPGDQVVLMSNGGFGGIYETLLQALAPA